MKMQHAKSKSGLFLIELIIAIVFFAVASAICMQLFVKSHLISQRSHDVSAATVLAQSYAERFKAVGAEMDSSSAEIYYGYDENGQLRELDGAEDAAAYVLTAVLEEAEAPLYTARVSVFRWQENQAEEENALCSLQVTHYQGR